MSQMGLGKTLTAIAVLWHHLSGRKARGVVICPSSLVDNWCKEVKRWLSVKLPCIVVKPGQSANAEIKKFVIGDISMGPLLIISYEVDNLLYLSLDNSFDNILI